MKTDLFQSCGHCWVFQTCWHIECSTFTASAFRLWKSSTGILSPPLALFVVMDSKAHLTSHSRMSGSRWVITPSWLSWSWRYYFLYSSSVYSCHLFLISSASVRSIPFVLNWAHLCMKCSLGISNFLEEISRLSDSVVFLYFFTLIPEEDFLISLCYSLNSVFKCVNLSFSPLPLSCLLFTAIWKASSGNHFAFWHFFLLGRVLISASSTMSRNCVHSSSGTLSIRSNPLKLSLQLNNHKGFDLGHT